MTRESRMLVIIGVMGLLGLSALFLLANRYAKLRPPLESVDDVEVAPVSTPVVPAIEDAADAGAHGAAADSAAAKVEGLFVGRRAMMGVLEEHPEAQRRMRHPLYNLVLIQIRVARTEALEGVGMSEEEYAEVRDAWRAWKEGEEIDPELAAAFEQRKDELAEIELGKLEAIDN